jgi:hypothetical protein
MYRKQKQDNTTNNKIQHQVKHGGKCTENKNKGTKEQSTIPVQTLRQMYRKQKQAEITKEQSTTPVQTVR